ncbi:MAG: hypothetical protein R3335_01185 [Anaerolineales bacterium]|nr:hypothetical protein [Anaerolineales bacterium]
MAEELLEKEEQRRRPFGLYMIVVLQVLIAVVLVLSLSGVERADPYLRALVQNPLYYTYVGWGLVIALVLGVIGMLRLRRWGWVLTMVITGLGLIFSIWSYFEGNFNYVAMIVNIMIVFYLNQRDVQAPFIRWNPPRGAQ